MHLVEDFFIFSLDTDKHSAYIGMHKEMVMGYKVRQGKGSWIYPTEASALEYAIFLHSNIGERVTIRNPEGVVLYRLEKVA